MAQATVFGWMVSGPVPSCHMGMDRSVSHQLLCLNVTDDVIKSFWNLESIGIVEKDSVNVNPVLQEFEKSVSMVDGRYEVALPWRPGAASRLQNNVRLAAIRLRHLDKRLAQNLDLKVRYDAVIHDMLVVGIVEVVSVEDLKGIGPVFYMPHRPVVRETAVSTKVRPVFDASAKGYNGVSLNDCMEVGPCLLSNLTEILLRFRRWKVAITADVEKAFLQISVSPGDRDVHRFLWNLDGEVRHMRFRRVPFGNCSSPFLLNATVKHHLATCSPSQAVQELNDNLYVDDLLTGADSTGEACSIIHDASSVMKQASMPLAKWVSNSAEVADVLQREFQDKCLQAASIKVLGIKWLAASDVFSFSVASLPEGVCVTKRIVLSFFSRLFDPLGFTAPFAMLAKCLFQELWSLGLQWDDELPEEYKIQFLQWVDGLEILQRWTIPRSYTGVGWTGVKKIQLHGFGDASPKGYGACIFLRAEMVDGSVATSLVIAKAKIAPLKKLTLPRLELLGCLLCSRLLVFARDALQLPQDCVYCCWTDSMIALSWIRSHPNRWKTFVANRVAEIQSLTSSDNWFHCPGCENPADLLTRGLTAEELVNSNVWLHGPKFLLEDPAEFQFELCGEITASDPVEETSAHVCISSEKPSVVFEVERWGSVTKAIRVVAWVRRFLFNIRESRAQRRGGEVTYKELQDARRLLLQKVQEQEFPDELRALRQGQSISKSSPLFKLTPYIADDGLLRMEGRLQFSHLSFDEKHPILLPKCHLAVLLVRFQHVLMKHAGVSTMITALRKCYWIIGVRRIAKRVKKTCASCQRQDAAACSQPMAPLPPERVNPAVPFAVTGLDHAGPLYCCDMPRKKFWVLLFTCGVVRAVHLELVESLSTPETILAIRRLSARRGLPEVIYSDNAKGFKASPTALQRQFGHVAPEWKFIAPHSPWWGGWWERLVQSVKSALKKTIGAHCLTRTELETTIQEVESCINSRPLTFVSDEPDDDEPLTPAHFLLGHGLGYIHSHSTIDPLESPSDLGHRYELRKSLLDKFWSVWTADYIRNLPPWRGFSGRCDLKEGSLVLVQDLQRSRLKWPLGVVTRLIPGKDGVVRTVEVRTASGNLLRSVPRIHDLELVPHDLSDTLTGVNRQPVVAKGPGLDPVTTGNAGAEASKPYVTRYGRVVKPVTRMDV